MLINIVGAGPGSEKLYTDEMIQVVNNSDVVLTSERLCSYMAEYSGNVKTAGVSETLNYIESKIDDDIRVCVVASGDTGFYSIASTINRKFCERADIKYTCGISSMQYFCSITKQNYDDMRLVSLHGRTGSIVPYVCYNRKVFALTGGDRKAGDIINELIEYGLADVNVYIGENLSMDNETIVGGKPADLVNMGFGDLAVMIIINEKYVNCNKSLKDVDFTRGKTPMTKKGVRDLATAALEIQPSDVVYDIGAGTGAMTCAMALKASESMVYAIEKDQDAIDLIKRNIESLGTKNICLEQGNAPENMEKFPPADKVFIGGSSGNLGEIVRCILQSSPEADILVTAVTLETFIEAITLFEALDMNVEVTCVNISNAEKLGRYNLMKAENPVYLIKGVAKFEE